MNIYDYFNDRTAVYDAYSGDIMVLRDGKHLFLLLNSNFMLE